MSEHVWCRVQQELREVQEGAAAESMSQKIAEMTWAAKLANEEERTKVAHDSAALMRSSLECAARVWC